MVLIGLVLAFAFYKFKKRKVAFVLLVVDIVFFLLCSTAYLPTYFAQKLEGQYPPLDIARVQQLPGKVYIHVLGSGCNLDSSLPVNSRMEPVAIIRLTEALRIYRQVANSVIVCSGGSKYQEETQAVVTRNTALMLGVDSNRLATLTTPLTTVEEAQALAALIGKQSTVIIATDAVHMPRAMKLFKQQGFNPIAAPANYRAPFEKRAGEPKWVPKTGNISLMDVVIHEWLGAIKQRF